MAQFARPVSDVTVGEWLAVPLHAKLSEAVVDDGTFIVGDGPGYYCEVALGPVEVPKPGTVSLRIRARKDPTATAAIDLTVRLVEGETVRAERTFANLTTGFATQVMTLTQGERDAVTNWGNLRVQMVRIGVTVPIAPIVAATAATQLEPAGTTHAMNLPTGIQAGDLLLAVFNGAANQTYTLSLPSGWESLYDATNGFLRSRGAWRVATGDEGSTVSVSTAEGTRFSSEVFRITGWDDSGLAEDAIAVSTTVTGSSAAPDPGSRSLPWGDEPTLALAVAHSAAGGSITYPSGFTEGLSAYTGVFNNFHARTSVARAEVDTSPVNPGAFGIGSTHLWTAHTIVVRGTGVGGPVDPPPPPSEETQTALFTEDFTTDFPNPERGWIPTAGGSSIGRTDLHTLTLESPVGNLGVPYRVLWRNYDLGNFRNSAISTAWLDGHRAELAHLRNHGLKMMPRYAYQYGVYPDAPISRVLEHITQLGAVWTDYQDVIAVLQAGFIGRWGEWHNSTNNLVHGSDGNGFYRTQIKNALMAAAPSGIMIQFRTPNFLGPSNIGGDIPQGWYSTFANYSNRFQGGEQERAGLKNDQVLYGSTNGSWWDQWDGTTEQRDRDIVAATTPITAVAGETDPAVSSTNTGAANVIPGLGLMHMDLLHANWMPAIYSSWAAESYQGSTLLQAVSRRLGYRFVLKEVMAPTSVTPGATAQIRLDIQNVGFGKAYNRRPIDLVFIGSGGPFTVRLSADARRSLPLGGQREVATYTFTAPAGLVVGQSYALHLRFPDPASGIASDNRYTIRLANTGMWDANTGRHSLGMSVAAV